MTWSVNMETAANTSLERTRRHRGLVCTARASVVLGLVVALLFISGLSATGGENPPGVRVATRVDADSVTVGERLRVVHRVTYPDSLAMLPPEAFDPGTCRLLSVEWIDEAGDGYLVKEARLEVLTTDLEAAFMPAGKVGFVAPAGDTLTAVVPSVDVPVRHLVSEGREPNPLKPQWEAPRSYTWLLLAAAAIALAALAVWLLRKRKRKEAPEPVRPELPPDFVALKRLDEIERLGLVEKGEIKKHYTLVVDTLRTYVEKRFGVLAMDETTDEILSDLMRSRVIVDGLEPVLREADLVKFAKFQPEPPVACGLVESVREIVARTAPRPFAEEPIAETAVE
jgi:LPXTG-motif cell wall-anchored protein